MTTTCLDCTPVIELEIRDDEYAEYPRCGRGYEIAEQNGHRRFTPLGDDVPIVKQRLQKIRDWTEERRENPESGGPIGEPPA
jgi:hypothetical protein